MTAVGFEPTPLRNGALSHRLRPLGQTVLMASAPQAATDETGPSKATDGRREKRKDR